MKKKILLTLVLAVSGMVSLMAQTTALVTYNGGYFVKDGKEWTEYRPADKLEPWNEQQQVLLFPEFHFPVLRLPLQLYIFRKVILYYSKIAPP